MADGGPLRFSADDVAFYAEASGDRNPLHVDDAFARRTPFGQRIVHGALAATALLGRLPPEARERASAVRVHLAGPLLIGAEYGVEVEPRRDGPWQWEARLTGRGKTLVRLWTAETEASARSASAAEDPPGRPMRGEAAACTARWLDSGTVVRGVYSSRRLADLARRFSAERASPTLVDGLACASYVTGMEVPGLHGLLATIDLNASRDAAPIDEYDLRVEDVDSRTGRIVVAGDLLANGGPGGTLRIEAFVREPVVSAAEPLAKADARLGIGAVVVGASRGLGAEIVLELLGRGYDVHALFAVSSSAAEELEHRAGVAADRLVLRRADAADPAGMAELAGEIARNGTALVGLVLSAAAPPLGMGLTAESADELAGYVAGSLRLVATPLGALLPLLAREGGWLAFTSSTALDEPPRDWPQYVAAKGAIEGLAAWAAATRPDLRTVVVRPHKLATDFSNTPAGRIGAAEPAEIAREIVRYLDAAPPGLTTLCP